MQALGGAAAVTAVLELLPATVGSERRATAVWATAGATGAALGPAIGGILTELVSWQSIFLAPGAGGARRRGADPRRRQARGGDRGHRSRSCAGPAARTCSPNLALAMVSAAIAAALFLLVLLLIEGWRLSPIGAAIVVTVMPLAALARRPARPRSCPSARARAAAGAILVSGGLGGLALLPKARGGADRAAADPGRRRGSRWCSRR